MARASLRTCWLASVAATAAPAAALAQEDGALDRTPRDCISVQSIDRTDAIDDQNLIFYMRGRGAYRNHLPRTCPGLEQENRIAYETRGSRLCSADTVTVLEQWGAGLQRGFTCRLGQFVPLSETEIEDLKLLAKENQPRGRGIEARPVEVEEAREPAAETESAPAAEPPESDPR